MNVSLTPELEAFITQQLSSGLYNSASEVVRQALRLLVDAEQQKQVKLIALRKAISDGVDSGDATTWDVSAFLQEARESK